MDASLELLQSLAHSDDKKALTVYLDFCTESKLFCVDKKKREEICSLINNLISSKENVKDGLVILEHFVHQCPKEVLSINILSWIQGAIKVLVNSEDGSFNSVACNVIGLLIQQSSYFPEARKQIALTTIPRLLDHLIKEAKVVKEENIIIFKGLEQILNVYGKSCGYHKDALSSIIFAHLESSTSVVYVASQCYLNLAASGPPGINSDNYCISWFNKQKFLLNSLHSHLDILLGNIFEAQDEHRVYKLDESHPTIPKIVEKNLTRKHQRLAKQFHSLAYLMKTLLLGAFPVKKKILPESILALVWRGLAMNHKTLSTGPHSIDRSSLMTVISQINIACLNILHALILSCRLNLIQYYPLICKIMTQALKWTEVDDWPYGVSKPQCLMRVETYKCLSDWLTVCRASSGIEKHLDEIIPSIILDIHHEPPTVILKVPIGKGKKQMEKNRESLKPIINFLVDPEMNATPCEAALKFISTLFCSNSTLIKSNYHQLIQEAIVGKLINLVSHEVPPPYSNSGCRLALYKALDSLCHNSHHSYPPPVNYAPQIFSEGIKDTSLEVSEFCLLALRNISSIVRPICPTLNFPSSNEGIENINVSFSENVNYLLNEDSNRKLRLKRKRNQNMTSTPVSESRKKRASTSEHNVSGLINLSSFMEGVNGNVSFTEEREEVSEMENKSCSVLEPGLDETNNECVEKEEEYCKVTQEIFLTEANECEIGNPNIFTNNSVSSATVENGFPLEVPFVKKVDHNLDSSVSLIDDKTCEANTNNLSNNEPCLSKDNEDACSDDDMINSFVDEVIQEN